MTQADILDADRAYDAARELVGDVAGSHLWSDDDLNAALEDLADAYDAADDADWWGADAGVFWGTAADLAAAWDADGADGIAEAFASAAGTVRTVEQEEVDTWDVVTGTVTESAEDVRDVAEEVGDVAGSRWTWFGLGGLGLLGLLAYLA